MLRSWRVGQAFGIPLFINPTFLLIVLWVLFENRGQGPATAVLAVAVLLAVFACVVLHELGHALMARYFGIRTLDITLYPIGGVARLDRLSDRPHEELCIALAGPAVNVVIAALLTPLVAVVSFVGMAAGGPDVVAVSEDLPTLFAKFLTVVWASNIFLVLFNLIPAFPMDGGRVLRAILSGWLGEVRATDAAGRIGLVLAAGLAVFAVLALNPFLLLISLFVVFVGQQERLMVRYREAQRRSPSRWSSPSEHVTVSPARTAEPAATAPRGFSGVAWDATHRVWVCWVDGRPVGYYAQSE
jgi:Zn-dependent protease